MLKDRMKYNVLGSMKIPKLHGHLKVTTSYAKSGNIAEVVECDNIVTNALADIFENNYFGGIDGSKMMPLYSKWFAGILMYETAFATSGTPAVIDPDNYYPQADSTNHLFAHAGDVAPSDTSDDSRRGSPNTIAQQVTDGMVKMAWEWGSAQGNSGDRYIRSVALTHKDTGNCGLGSSSQAFAAFNPWENISNLSNITLSLSGDLNVFAQYDDNHGLAFYIGEEGEYTTGRTKFDTQKITVWKKMASYLKTGLAGSVNPTNSNASIFTVTTPIHFYRQPSFYFDYTNKYLWLFTNATAVGDCFFSKTDMQYCVIDCENEALVNLGTEQEPAYSGTIVADTSCLAPVSQDRNYGGYSVGEPCFVNIVKNGDYFYFPTTTLSPNDWNYNNLESNAFSGYLKVNITDTTDQTLIPLTYYRTRSGMASGGLTIIDGRVINGNDAFTIPYVLPWDSYCNSSIFNQPNKPVSYVMSMGNGATNKPRMILANKMVHTTMLNLPAAVQKTTAKNMNVEYVLTEV